MLNSFEMGLTAEYTTQSVVAVQGAESCSILSAGISGWDLRTGAGLLRHLYNDCVLRHQF